MGIYLERHARPCTEFPKEEEQEHVWAVLIPKSTENEGRSAQVDRFLAARGAGSGRLVFALDATASRLPLWGMARELTAGMIREAASIGTLNLQLVYFRGGVDSPPECVASQWTSGSARLAGDDGATSNAEPATPRSAASCPTRGMRR